MCAAQAQRYPQIQTHAHLKSSRQRARVDGQVHFVAHIHGVSLDSACVRLATQSSSWLFLRRRPLLVHSGAASIKCLVTHMLRYRALDRGGVNCSVLVRAETSTSLCASVVERVFWQQCAAFVNVVVSMFSVLEAGAGALTSRAQKMCPTTHKFETLLLPNCTSPHSVVNVSVLETGGVCTQKSRTEHAVTDLIFDGCLLHVFTHFSCCAPCAEKATICCICRRVLQGSRILQTHVYMFFFATHTLLWRGGTFGLHIT